MGDRRPSRHVPAQAAIGRPLANGVAADLAAIAADVERQLPEIKAGSLCVYGDIFGGAVDNIHVVVGARLDEHEGCLVVECGGGESLSVWDPGAVTISERAFSIGRASRVRWEWYYYGRPRLPENRYFIEHVRTDGGVRAQTNASWAHHPFAPSPRRPAVELLGY